ncbi:MAG: glycosyltransferase family 4 protein [Blastocatellia bacterium]|nr:glycosyltransferase family 4 protein [Blastocatellia bacterium]
MRILFLNPLSELGGAERCLLDLQASLAELNPAPEMHLAVGGPGPLVDEAEGIGVRVHVVSMPQRLAAVGDSAQGGSSLFGLLRMMRDTALGGAAAIGYVRRLRSLVRGVAPDVLYSNGIKSHLMATLASGGVPVVWHIRDLIGRRRLVARVLRLAAPRATLAIAISRLVERDAREVLGSLPIHVVHDAIDTDAFSPGPGDGDWLDHIAGFPVSPVPVVRVGLIATFARWKGQDVLLDAIARIPESPDGVEVRYFIVGGPIYETRGSQFSEAELCDHADRLGVSARVGFVPFQNGIVEVFRALDVVVHASTQPEPFGRTIAEAMACGRAVVMTNATGAGELTDEQSATQLPPGDAAVLAQAIRTIAVDPASRSRMGNRGREVAVEQYSRARLGSAVMKALLGVSQ